MILSAHQPAYLPWLGYFDKISKSDIFIFLDSVQYEKNSFINRNKIKTPNGAVWLTVPVKAGGHTTSTLIKTEIDGAHDWKDKHLKTIYHNYRKAPFFETLYPKMEDLYHAEERLLSDLCYLHLQFWMNELGISGKIVRSSRLPVAGYKSELILNLCKYFNADKYLSGALGKNYLKEPDFKKEGIAIEYQDYRHPVYDQLYGSFIPFMGVVDFCMNTNRLDAVSGNNRP